MGPLLLLLATSTVWAAPPQSLVVLGGTDPEAATSTVPGGWVTVLQDCLEERAPQGWDVAQMSRDRIAGVREIGPTVVLIATAPDEGDLSALIKSLQEPRNPRIVLLGWSASGPGKDGTEHIDLSAAVEDAGWKLSDQGHARVAATVCDALVPAPPRKKRH